MTNTPIKDRIWRIDETSLHEVLLDPEAALALARQGSPMERIWALRLLEHLDRAASEAEDLLEGAADPFGPLLLLAHIYQCQYRWAETTALQNEALFLSRTPAQEAAVHQHTGRRLLEEGRYQEAAGEFDWAVDLHRTTGGSTAETQLSLHALNLARRLAAERSVPGEPSPHSTTMSKVRFN
jgi:tetratricopeptide (TPR) repeat protein